MTCPNRSEERERKKKGLGRARNAAAANAILIDIPRQLIRLSTHCAVPIVADWAVCVRASVHKIL